MGSAGVEVEGLAEETEEKEEEEEEEGARPCCEGHSCSSSRWSSWSWIVWKCACTEERGGANIVSGRSGRVGESLREWRA